MTTHEAMLLYINHLTVIRKHLVQVPLPKASFNTCFELLKRLNIKILFL